MKKDNKTDNSRALATTPKKAIEKVGNIIALTDKLLLTTFDKWAWWNGLSEEWKIVFRLQIGDITNRITANKLKEIKRLDYLSCSNIEKKNGILVSHTPEIKELSPLKDLTNLKTLSCCNKKIVNIEVLKYLKNLESLSLSGCLVKDLTPLKKLERLKELNLQGTKIKTIEPIQNIKSLRYLSVSNTSVSQSEVDEFKIINPNCKID